MRDMEHVKKQSLHDSMNNSFRRELFDPLTRAMQDGIERAELRQSDSEFYAWIFLGLVNTFVRAGHYWPIQVLLMIHSCWPRGRGLFLRRCDEHPPVPYLVQDSER